MFWKICCSDGDAHSHKSMYRTTCESPLRSQSLSTHCGHYTFLKIPKTEKESSPCSLSFAAASSKTYKTLWDWTNISSILLLRSDSIQLIIRESIVTLYSFLVICSVRSPDSVHLSLWCYLAVRSNEPFKCICTALLFVSILTVVSA